MAYFRENQRVFEYDMRSLDIIESIIHNGLQYISLKSGGVDVAALCAPIDVLIFFGFLAVLFLGYFLISQTITMITKREPRIPPNPQPLPIEDVPR